MTGEHPGLERLTFDDSQVYTMLCRRETIGVFQLESRAQAELVRNFRLHCFANLTVKIALGRKRAEAALQQFKAQFLARAQANGAPQKIGETVFAQMQAFGSYAFPRATDTERLWMEVATTGVTAQGHLARTVAQTLRAMEVMPSTELSHWPDGTKLRVGEAIIARQRPPAARGVVPFHLLSIPSRILMCAAIRRDNLRHRIAPKVFPAIVRDDHTRSDCR